MKKNLLLIATLFLFVNNVHSQVTKAVNTSGTSNTDYVGWDNGTTDPVRIKHENNRDIEFYTNTGAGTFGTPKMMLDRAGYLGLGTGTTTPSSWLHIITSGSTLHEEPFRTAVASSTEINWRMYKGTNQIMRIYSPSSGDGLFVQAPRGSIKFSSGNNGTVTNAMEITGSGTSTAGNVLIGNYSTFTGSARLHVKGSGYSSLFKVENSTLSTPTLEVTEGDQVFFKSVGFTSGGLTTAAFSFDYSPSSSVSYASGTLDNVNGTLQIK